MSDIITPEKVERRLRDLGRELDEANSDLGFAENSYGKWKADFELQVAKARLRIGKEAAETGSKITVQEKEDRALVECELAYKALIGAEAVVRAARANVQRVRTQIDIARSVGTSVRSAMELS
jgi:hypothetical protein